MTNNMCSVRERRHDDLPTLASALIRVHASDGYPVEGVADPIGWLHRPHALRSWTAVIGDLPIGQVTLTEADSNDDAAVAWTSRTGGLATELALIVRLFVDPRHRAVGAGMLLTGAALSHAKEIEKAVALDVMAKDRAAIRLYEKLGGRRIGRTDHHYGDGLSEPAIIFDFPKLA